MLLRFVHWFWLKTSHALDIFFLQKLNPSLFVFNLTISTIILLAEKTHPKNKQRKKRSFFRYHSQSDFSQFVQIYSLARKVSIKPFSFHSFTHSYSAPVSARNVTHHPRRVRKLKRHSFCCCFQEALSITVSGLVLGQHNSS